MPNAVPTRAPDQSPNGNIVSIAAAHERAWERFRAAVLCYRANPSTTAYRRAMALGNQLIEVWSTFR